MQPGECDAWREADRILDTLLDLPATEREQALAALSLAQPLREKVRRLLVAHVDSGPLEQLPPMPETAGPATDASTTGLEGRLLDRWRLGAEIGRGGMSVVYRAVAEGGATGQLAAIKVLTLGSLAHFGRERFLREQQALLRLHHPYIAALYDAGIADDGTPWLAMALVEGEHIDQWCARHALDVPARVRLVLQVGEALAYIHRNLVIHRDIKPSNVLVDDDGHVRLLDFGIARLTGAVDSDTTTTWLRVLTPEYASPEQFDGAPPSTMMDVYGLAALLYRLLTGAAPRCGNDTTTPVMPPSRAAASRGEKNAPVGAVRQLRGDLDRVLLKALAEYPEDRYRSVEALVVDLRRWLQRRPVRAHPPSLHYRVGKYFARNRLALAATGALLLAILGGVATTLWQVGEARQQTARAQLAATKLQAQLNYLHSVLGVLAPGTEASRELDRYEMITEAARRARQELSGQPDVLASVELSLGDIARRTGDYQRAHALFSDALHIRRRIHGVDSLAYGEALLSLGTVTDKVNPPDFVLAESRLRQAVELLEQHQAGPRLRVEGLIEHANRLVQLGRHDEARQRLEEAGRQCRDALVRDAVCDRVWSARGSLERQRNNVPAAVAAYAELLELRRARFGEDHARTAVAYARLGHALARKGEHTRGLALLERAYALGKRTNATINKDNLQTLCDLAEAYLVVNRTDEAEALFDRYLDGAASLFGEHSTEFAYGLGQVGSLYYRSGRYAEAAEAWGRSHAIYTRLLGSRAPTTALYLGRHADALNRLGQHARALPLAEQALALHRAVLGEDAVRTGTRWNSLGNVLLELERYPEALEAYAHADRIFRGATATGLVRKRTYLTRSQRALALAALGRRDEALIEARMALATAEAMGDRNSAFYGRTLANLVVLTCRAGPAEADACSALQARARREARSPALAMGGRRLLEQAQAGAEPSPQVAAGTTLTADAED